MITFKGLKQFLVILHLSIFTLSFSEIHQFFKIPVFFDHLQEHRLINPETTVWDFILEHYQGNFEKDEDFQRDNALPFRNAECINNLVNVQFVETPETIVINHPFSIIPLEYTVLNDSRTVTGIPSGIWQPPRL